MFLYHFSDTIVSITHLLLKYETKCLKKCDFLPNPINMLSLACPSDHVSEVTPFFFIGCPALSSLILKIPAGASTVCLRPFIQRWWKNTRFTKKKNHNFGQKYMRISKKTCGIQNMYTNILESFEASNRDRSVKSTNISLFQTYFTYS